MVKSISQLRKEIAEQRKRIAKETKISNVISEKEKLSTELFKLKHRKLIGAGAKAKRLSVRFGKALLKVGQKASPIIQKQARLIRDQQLRDDAIARGRLKQTKKIKRKAPLTTKTIKKTKRTSPREQQDLGVFGNLDF